MTPTFDDMPILASPPLSPPRSGRKSWARNVERCCMKTIVYFPLLFIYGLSTWAVWVALGVCFFSVQNGLTAYSKAGLVTILYVMMNISYTTAVFTSPGSPSDPRRDQGSNALGQRRKNGRGGSYEGVASQEQSDDGGPSQVPYGPMTSVTAKSTGQPRYCKKCHHIKPDRAHHCSSCGRCVLKMDHHCPWLATCVGLRNYKSFMLFLVYTSLFCWLCFAISASWVWAEIMDETQMQEGLRVVNTILLAILGGIIGLVLSGFTAWHFYLCLTGQTTIESLEKTRYLAPLRKSLEPQPHRTYVGMENTTDGRPSDDTQTLTEQIKEIHANALPGVLRSEEGDAPLRQTNASQPLADSPAKSSLQRSYADLEAQREHDRYAAYLDELDSEKLPNAFNTGWKRNLGHVFGAAPLLWAIPICNTSGDGWQWEVSPQWIEARDRLANQRAANSSRSRNSSFEPPRRREFIRWTPGIGFADQARTPPPPQARSDGVQMLPLEQRRNRGSGSSDDYETGSSSDDDAQQMYRHSEIQGVGGTGIANWNDVPDEYLAPGPKAERGRSRGRQKGD
nr:palmitoyltransferase pfa3 [Quercus suber]